MNFDTNIYLNFSFFLKKKKINLRKETIVSKKRKNDLPYNRKSMLFTIMNDNKKKL